MDPMGGGFLLFQLEMELIGKSMRSHYSTGSQKSWILTNQNVCRLEPLEMHKSRKNSPQSSATFHHDWKNPNEF